MRRKICVVTGSRAEFGLLLPLIRKIEASPLLDLSLVVTGSHLAALHGNTVDEILGEGLRLDAKVEMLVASDTPTGLSKSLALGVLGMSEAFDRLQPDLIVVLGDRTELLSVAVVAVAHRIPIAHLHGGERSEGAMDEAVRHALTKMSHLHFVSTEEYRHRVIQLGEDPENVFDVGAIGVDGIRSLDPVSKSDLEAFLNFELDDRTLAMTYHPQTLVMGSPAEEVRTVAQAALDADWRLVISKPNSDLGNSEIVAELERLEKENPDKMRVVSSLGQRRYHSLLKWVKGVIGNSSSGLIEAPYFGIGTLNIGHRQDGRAKGESIIDCDVNYEAIRNALAYLESDLFRDKLRNAPLIYGDGTASPKIASVLETADLQTIKVKRFHDICVP